MKCLDTTYEALYMYYYDRTSMLAVCFPFLNSYPLALYSRRFITTVVLGNDMIPR